MNFTIQNKVLFQFYRQLNGLLQALYPGSTTRQST